MSSTSEYLPFLLLSLFSLNCQHTSGSFFAVVPHEFHAGWPLKVVATSHRLVQGPVYTTVTLSAYGAGSVSGGTALGQATEILDPGDTKPLTIQVPEIVPDGMYKLAVKATGGLEYELSSYISMNRNSSIILVETDKAIYKPGQLVRIRVVHIDKQLMPVLSPISIVIENSKGSKLEEFKDIFSDTGVAEAVFQLSANPSLGLWRVYVTYDNDAQHTATFTVEEFVLPKFSVEVKADPNYLVLSNKELSPIVTVEALYTYGKGVQGKCKLSLSTPAQGTIIVITKELDEMGKAEFNNIEWPLITSAITKARGVFVKAEVTDETDRTEAGQTTLDVNQYDKRINILPASTMVLRYGFPADIHLRVSDHSGNPIGASELEVTIVSQNIQNVDVELTVPDGATDVTYTFKPIRKTDNFEEIGKSELQVKLKSDTRITASLDLETYRTVFGNSIIVIPKDKNQVARVGEAVEFQVMANPMAGDDTATFAYLALSQGSVVEAGVPVGDSITIVPTQAYCPHSELVVYMMAGRNITEVVVDTVNLTPTNCFDKELEVSFNAAETRAGADANMVVNVNRMDGSNELPGVHDVYYLAVDKSITLLHGSTYLKEDEVADGLSSLDSRFFRFKSTAVAATASAILEDVGLVAYTSAQMVKDEEPIDHLYPEWDMMELEGAGPMFAMADFDDDDSILFKGQDMSQEDVAPKVPKNNQETKVRKDFPDTWLWAHGKTEENGRLSKSVTLPDTITTWMVSAFAINRAGLAVCNKPFELTAFQLFFLTMNLPYSIKRGEVFVLRVTVFNYRSRDVTAVIRLEKTNQFTSVDRAQEGDWIEYAAKLPAGRASSVMFSINATTVGNMDLHVVAEDIQDGMMDEVRRQLIVKPEGEERSRAITKALILSTATEIDQTFRLDWPYDKIVPDSRRVEVKVTGDVFGQALSNLGSLVRVPFGCGEQNMITTVPNILGMTYIRSTNQVGLEELEETLLKNMKLGYQREIDNYRHSDGSYSAWGENRSSGFHAGGETAVGSTWLTAFVVKTFSQASNYIHVDNSILTSGLSFLRYKQIGSGEFRELGNVIHSEMQSGTGSGPGLTVYVLISMLETTRAIGDDQLNLKRQIESAIRYIKTNIETDLRTNSNKFLAAMSAYALTLVPEKDTEVTFLIDKFLQHVVDMGAPWLEESKLNADQPMVNHVGYGSSQQRSLGIEVAAYYLLALTRLGRLGEGVAVMKWLQSQQNSFGGYGSTQDTVMGLQALSEFGAAFSKSQSIGTVTVREPVSGQSYELDITGSRAILLQKVELPSDTDTVEVKLTGAVNSFAVIKVVYTYYTLAGDDDLAPPEPEVEVYTRTSRVSSLIHNVEACVKSSKTLKYNGMFVTTLNLPSGEKALEDPATIMSKNPQTSKVETEEGAIHFYMDEPPGDGYCLQVQLERELEFEVQKPGSAKIYPYYEPEMVKEVALSLEGSACRNDNCDRGSAVMLNMASVLLTIIICALISLLMCV